MVENPDYAAFMTRVVAAYGRRAGDDIEALRDLADLHRKVNAEIVEAVRRLHDEEGHSCAEIAERLDVTKQAVHKRFFARGHVDERCRGMEPLFPVDEPAAPGDEQRASLAC